MITSPKPLKQYDFNLVRAREIAKIKVICLLEKGPKDLKMVKLHFSITIGVM